MNDDETNKIDTIKDNTDSAKEFKDVVMKLNIRLAKIEQFFEAFNDFLSENLPFSHEMNGDILHTAFHVIEGEKKISCSYLQRKLGISYGHAEEVMEKLEVEGVVEHEEGEEIRTVHQDVLEKFMQSDRHIAFHKSPKPPYFDEDSDMQAAIKLICQYDSMSVSMLQRRLGIGFNRAANLMEKLENEGYVGFADGSKPRKVLIK